MVLICVSLRNLRSKFLFRLCVKISKLNIYPPQLYLRS